MLSHNHNNYQEHNFGGALKFTEYNNVIGVHHIAYTCTFLLFVQNEEKTRLNIVTQKKKLNEPKVTVTLLLQNGCAVKEAT